MDAYNYVIPEYGPETETYKMRHQINIDDYARFKWRGADSYDAFGCLITNVKDLKWTNYASFTDEYTKPMFSSASSYVGTTYQQKQLQLKLGVYWITADDYRAFLNWISPDIVGDFEYSYNLGWQYKVKVSAVTETVYYSIGYNENAETVYYAELTVTFKTVEDNAVISVNPWPTPLWLVNDDTCVGYYFFGRLNTDITWKDSELSTSIRFIDTIPWKEDVSSTSTDKIVYQIYLRKFKDNITSIPDINPSEIAQYFDADSWLLFEFTTNNIEGIQNINLMIDYDSQLGQLYINNNLISSLNVLDNKGNEIIRNYQVNKMILPGSLNNQLLQRNISAGTGNEAYLLKPLFLSIAISRNDILEKRWNNDEMDSSINNIIVYPKREL